MNLYTYRFSLQDEARKKFREGDALKYLGFLEKAIGDGGKDGYAVSSSVSPSFDIMHCILAHQIQIPAVFTHFRYRGSYISAHVLLNLVYEFGKRDKMRGLPSIFSLYRNEFNKFNNTRARMLDSIYHMTLRLL